MKSEEKDWLFKDEMIKVSREEKSLKRIRDLNKDGVWAFRGGEGPFKQGLEKERLLKEKSPKEEKLRLYKEERKKKSKDRPQS